LERSLINSEQLVHAEEFPGRNAPYATLVHDFQPTLTASLVERDMPSLFTHQARAIGAALDGHDVAAVTPAASGKTLYYDIPIIQSLLNEPTSRALFLYYSHPGSVGIAEHGFDVVEELLGATLAVIEEWPCPDGCPGCVQPPSAVTTTTRWISTGPLRTSATWRYA
jgi:ATP-dependent helicase YprA (DUF1998 family)